MGTLIPLLSIVTITMNKQRLNRFYCVRTMLTVPSRELCRNSSGVTNWSLNLNSLVRHLWVCTCGICIFFCAVGYSQESKTTSPDPALLVTQDDVRPILRELESDLLETRDAAEKRLIALGSGVLRWLPEVKQNTSGEMKIRLLRIREQLSRQGNATFFEASTVTLNGKFKLAEAISQISSQTGNVIELRNVEGQADTEIEISADKAKFWDVLLSVLRLGKLSVDSFAPANGLILVPDRYAADDDSQIVAVHGPFMLNVVRTQSTLNLQSPVGSRMDISLLVTWEPRLKPVFLKLPMKQFLAEIDHGDPLEAVDPMAVPEFSVNPGMCSMQLDVALAKPPREVTALKKFTGEIEFAVPGEKQSFVFEKFTNGRPISVKHGDVNMVLEARRNNQLYEFRVRVDFSDTVGVLDSFRNWMATNNAYLIDDQGTRFEAFSNGTFATRTNSAGVSFIFQINGDPSKYKLVYDFPVTISRQNIAFELKDIPLP